METFVGEAVGAPERRTMFASGMTLVMNVWVLVLMLLGALPAWPHSRKWGYALSGGVGLILVIVLILFPLGKI